MARDAGPALSGPAPMPGRVCGTGGRPLTVAGLGTVAGGRAQAPSGSRVSGSIFPSSMAPRPWAAQMSGRSAMCTGMPVA